MRYKTKRLVTLAVLLALEIVLSRFLSIPLPHLKIGFAFLPIAIAAILYGPLWGGATAALADLVGALLFPIGAYFPGFTLTAFLRGTVYGLFFHRKKFRMSAVNAAVAIVCLVLNLGLDTLWLYFIMDNAIIALIPARALTNGVMVFVQAILISLFLGLGKSLVSKNENDLRDDLRLRAKKIFTGEKGVQLRAEASAAIAEHTLNLPDYRDARTVFCFVGTPREIDTEPLLRRILADGKTLCVPLCEPDYVMTARRIGSLDDLTAEGAFHILEPAADASVVDAADIDVAFIPCSAADKRGNRLGKGAGYYDRYLQGTRMRKIGLCPKSLTTKKLLPLPHDVPLDRVITEEGGLA